MIAKRMITLLLACALAVPAVAQTTQGSAPAGQKSLSATMGVYVFPKAGQPPDQQSKEEAECYDWAVQNTGTDPFDLAKKSEEQQKKAKEQQKQAKEAGKGAGAAGAVGGAAAGALIGAIAGDAGKGAAYGAAAGLVGGRRHGRSAQKQAEAEAQQQAQKTKQEAAGKMDAFKKAFSVCLEAKDYMVKY